VARKRRGWIRECLTPLAWYLSTKLPSPPTWSVPMVGARAGNALLAEVPMGRWETLTFIAGFSRAGIVALMLIKGAMTEQRSSLISNNVSSLLFGGGTSSSSTSSPSTRPSACRRQSRPVEENCDTCRSTGQTSTQSNWCSIPRRRCYAKRVSGLERCVRGLKPSKCVGYFRHCGYDPL
jgi:hypothetical protein